jgi:hypothetical protein
MPAFGAIALFAVREIIEEDAAGNVSFYDETDCAIDDPDAVEWHLAVFEPAKPTSGSAPSVH